MKEKIIEIVKSNDVLHTRYWTMGAPGVDEVCFEGRSADEERLMPLAQAKRWAKKHGYTHVLLISLTTRKQDKLYKL